MKIVWILPLIGSIAGTYMGYTMFIQADGAVQQIVGLALGLALAVIPYCFARALSELVTTVLPKWGTANSTKESKTTP